MFGVRDPSSRSLGELLKSAGGRARAGQVPEAATFGEVVVLATPWPATEQAIHAAGNLAGKTVVDCTNPLAPDLSGLVVGTNTSAGEEVARWAAGAKVVKAFNTIGAANFADPHFGTEAASMFIAGDDTAAKAVVTRLAAELGFDVVDGAVAGRPMARTARHAVDPSRLQGRARAHGARLQAVAPIEPRLTSPALRERSPREARRVRVPPASPSPDSLLRTNLGSTP